MTEGSTSTFRVLDGRYELTERIGSGGMGSVFRAHDLRLDRTVAVKLLRSGPDPVHRARLQAEARFAGGLQHPGIVRVYDYGEERAGAEVTPYVVMQLVEGEPLSERLRRAGPLPAAEVAALLAGLGNALTAAHTRGVVHRDLKPANIVITPEDEPVLVDFGVARSDAADPLTETGFIVGTADYLSPEQVEGQRATPASDVYALGVMAHQCLSGTSPFHRETQIATALAHLRGEVAALPAAVPARLQALVITMIDRDPAARPTAAEVAARAPAALTAPAAPTGATQPSDASPAHPAGPARRRRTALVLAAALVLVAAGLGLAVLGRSATVPPADADDTSPTPTPAVVRHARHPIAPRATAVATTAAVPAEPRATPRAGTGHASGHRAQRSAGRPNPHANPHAAGHGPRKPHGPGHVASHGKGHSKGHGKGSARGHGHGPGGH